MKQLLTSLLLGLSVLASAQSDGFQYPFPYNPDGNSDGYISLNDMLDLLALYGQEYPESFYADSSGALLFLGEMTVYDCLNSIETLQGNWRLPLWQDATKWMVDIATVGSEWFQEGGFTSGSISYLTENEAGALTRGSVSYYNSSYYQAFGVPYCQGASYPINNSEVSIHSTFYCFAVTEVRPEYEFSYCDFYTGGDFTTCVTDKLNDGWIPMPGGTRNGPGGFYQGFWRIVED